MNLSWKFSKSYIKEFFRKIQSRKQFEIAKEKSPIDVALKDPTCIQSLVAAFIIGFRSEVNLCSTELFLFSRTYSYDYLSASIGLKKPAA